MVKSKVKPIEYSKLLQAKKKTNKNFTLTDEEIKFITLVRSSTTTNLTLSNDQQSFPPLPPNNQVSVDFVENKMRSAFGVSNGLLSNVADRNVMVMSVEAGKEYYFRCFKDDSTQTSKYFSLLIN